MNLNKSILLALSVSAVLSIPPAGSLHAQESNDSSRTAGDQNVSRENGVFFSVPSQQSLMTPASAATNQLTKTPVANLTNTLYGLMQGLVVRQGSGEPGYDNASLSIRGRGTYDVSGPIYYVDGFQVTQGYFAYLSPEEIETISVLKDPGTLATFGMRGANGVIWVTTKRGKVSKQKVKFNLVNGWQQAMVLNKPLRSFDYARLFNQAVSNDQYNLNGNRYTWTPTYSDQQLGDLQKGLGTDVDWFNENLRKNGRYTNANVVLSGGDPGTRYNVLLDYMKHGGLYNVPSNDMTSNAQIQRFNIRTNLDFSFFKIFEAKVDLGGRIEDRRYPNLNGSSLWNNMSSYPSSIYPVKDASGFWSGTTLFPNNPVASVKALGWSSTQDRTLQANFALKEKLDFLLPGLYLSQAVSFNTWTRTRASKTATYARYFNGTKTTNDNTTDLVANGSTPEDQYDWKQMNLTAGYERTFGQHQLTAAVNYFASGFITDQDNNNVGQNGGNNIFYNFLNVGGRINYAYRKRYMAEIGFGYSGSDNFAAGNRWHMYPAVSAGWVASEEDFLRNSKAISFLKLRGSVGLSGWDLANDGRFLFQQYFVSNGSYLTGLNSLVTNSGLIQSYQANPDIAPERSLKYNVGMEATLFRNLSLMVDVFQDSRTDIVTQNNTIMGVFGGILPYVNLGRVQSRGMELALQYKGKVGALEYSVGGMYASYTNKILEQAEVPPVNAFSATTGLPIGAQMGLKANGFYDLTDFEANGALKAGQPVPSFGRVQPGDLKYMDLDGNKIIDQNDVTNIGNPNYPTGVYSINASLRFRGFDASVLFQGNTGASINILNAAPIQTTAFVNNANVFPIAKNAWAYYPAQNIDTRATADYPRLTRLANDNNYRSSTFWMKDASYLRIRNIELGYTLPASLLKKMRLETLRIFVNAVNPITWSETFRKYSIDPETPAGHPALKAWNTGITLNF